MIRQYRLERAAWPSRSSLQSSEQWLDSPVLDVRPRVLTAEHTQHDQHENEIEAGERYEDPIDSQESNDAITIQETVLLKVGDKYHMWHTFVHIRTEDFLRKDEFSSVDSQRIDNII